MVATGDPAPDFTLPGTDSRNHRDYTLSSFRGRPVVLVFYPGDNTPVCTRQLNAYTADIGVFDALDAQVLALSPQDIASHDDFATRQGGFAFPLLADTDKVVGGSYGIIGPLGFYRRSLFVVGPDGRVAYARRILGDMSFTPGDDLLDAIRTSGGVGT